MDELPPYLHKRHIEDGRGHVTWIFQPGVLSGLLESAGVSAASELPDDQLYYLCFLAGPEGQEEQAQKAEEKGEEHELVRISIDAEGNETRIDSSEPGAEFLAKRFPDLPEDKLNLLCNPLYNTVEIELWVFDTSPEASQDPMQNVIRRILAKTLDPLPPLPPDLPPEAQAI